MPELREPAGPGDPGLREGGRIRVELPGAFWAGRKAERVLMGLEACNIALRFTGVHELAGDRDNPWIQAFLSLCSGFDGDTHDEVPWCSAFVNACHWLAGLPRTKSASARSWLTLGIRIPLSAAARGDIVVLKRGGEDQPGVEVLAAQGHVGFFAGLSPDGQLVHVLAGNQGDAVNITAFPIDRILAVQRVQ